MRIIVYVEGRSDKDGLEGLLKPLIDQKLQNGVSIKFFETMPGDRKESVLLKIPRRAVDILRSEPDAIVVAMPDLYPYNKPFPHQTVEDLRAGIIKQFEHWRSHANADPRLVERFQVFCLKHDLEALVLAAHEALAARLNLESVKQDWTIPVEDQNHDHPPKRIVETLFADHDEKYVDTIDAPFILRLADYRIIAERCPQQFKPFVEFLDSA